VAQKSFIVTGGGSGLGQATAAALIQQGARVTICGRRIEKIESVAASLGPNCRAIQGDITLELDRAKLIEVALAHGGGLDGLVNNAGNMYRATIDALDEARLLDIFNQNVVAGLMLSKLAVPALEKTQGSIIFLGSIHTRRAFPGGAPYAATKAALQTITKVLAAELGPRQIRVNCVLPGAVLTEINERAGLGDQSEQKARLEQLAPLHALGRSGEPHEVAEAIVYLLNAPWTTGALLDVDGGLGLGIAPF